MNNNSNEILFDKFEVIELLKKDNHTAVYLADHIYLGKKIILKTLDKKELRDKTILERFKREAKVLAKLDHPNLIKVLDFGSHKHYFYISFEYFDARNLRKAINENSISEDEKRNLTIQLLKALNVAHKHQIIHRDIKPENILVDERLNLKIADFGLAYIENETIVTQQSSIVGTPGYMSPEQIKGERIDSRSDLFSAGLVIYELYTGSNPFIGKDINDTINNILNFNAEDLQDKIKSLPDDIRETITGLLKKNREKRIKTAADALRIMGVNATLYDMPVVENPQKDKKQLLVYTLVPVVLILFVAIYFISKGNGNTPPVRDPGNVVEESVADSLMPVNNENSFTGENNEKEDNNPPDEKEDKVLTDGKLFVEVTPYADVYINGKKIDTTPLDEYINLKPGRYTLKLVHPDYPPYTQSIRIKGNELSSLKVNMQNTVGYLDCKIYPYGNVYVDNQFKATTPLREAIKLKPGKHILKITHPDYDDYLDEINIKKNSTFNFQLNFEKISGGT